MKAVYWLNLIILTFSEVVLKFKVLKKSAHSPLINSLEVAIWKWMDSYPQEFGEIQVSIFT